MVKEETENEERRERVEPSTSTQSPRKGAAPWEKQCTVCQKTFVSTSSANRHLRTIHCIDTSSGNAGYIIDKVSSEGEEVPSVSVPLPVPPILAAEEENTQKEQPRIGSNKNCDLCQKSFSTGSTLNRHLRNVHGVDTSKPLETETPLPSGTLDCALSSLIHSALPHPLEITVDSKEGIGLMGEMKEEELEESHFDEEDSPTETALDNEDATSETASRDYDDSLEIRCDLCGKVFSQPSTLNRHLREIHKMTTIRKEQPMKPTACPVCGEILRSHSLALRHRKEVHGSSTKISRLGTRCNMRGCTWTGHTHRDLVSHAQSTHSTASSPFEWQCRSFETKQDFEKWIEEIRKEGVEWYSRSSKTIDGVKQEYRYCFLEIGGRGRKDADERPRIHCTSYIKLLLHDDSSVSAEFCLDHLGHEGKNCSGRKEEEIEEEETEKEDDMIDDHSEENLEENSLDLDDIPGPSRDSQNFVGVSSLISGVTPIDSDLGISGVSSSRARLCHNCGKEFSCGSTLYRHLREVHKEDHPKSETLAIKTPCAVCGEIFPSGSQMRVHRSTAHPGSLGHRMNCPLEGCGWNGSTHRDLIKHAHSLHSSPSSPFNWQTREFVDQSEFNEWLEELKKTGVHFYIRRSERRRSLKVENRCCYFEENRTRGVSSPSRQRKKFSRKSVGSCTCYLTLTIHEDGSVATGYCLDHLGHTVDLNIRPFGEGREERGEEDEEEEEEGEETIEETEEGMEHVQSMDSKLDLECFKLTSSMSDNHVEDPPRAITVQDLQRFQESLARISAGAARLRYSHEMDRLVTYLDSAMTATGLDDNASNVASTRGVKRRIGESLITNGKRVKREE